MFEVKKITVQENSLIEIKEYLNILKEKINSNCDKKEVQELLEQILIKYDFMFYFD